MALPPLNIPPPTYGQFPAYSIGPPQGGPPQPPGPGGPPQAPGVGTIEWRIMIRNQIRESLMNDEIRALLTKQSTSGLSAEEAARLAAWEDNVEVAYNRQIGSPVPTDVASRIDRRAQQSAAGAASSGGGRAGGGGRAAGGRAGGGAAGGRPAAAGGAARPGQGAAARPAQGAAARPAQAAAPTVAATRAAQNQQAFEYIQAVTREMHQAAENGKPTGPPNDKGVPTAKQWLLPGAAVPDPARYEAITQDDVRRTGQSVARLLANGGKPRPGDLQDDVGYEALLRIGVRSWLKQYGEASLRGEQYGTPEERSTILTVVKPDKSLDDHAIDALVENARQNPNNPLNGYTQSWAGAMANGQDVPLAGPIRAELGALQAGPAAGPGVPAAAAAAAPTGAPAGAPAALPSGMEAQAKADAPRWLAAPDDRWADQDVHAGDRVWVTASGNVHAENPDGTTRVVQSQTIAEGPETHALYQQANQPATAAATAPAPAAAPPAGAPAAPAPIGPPEPNGPSVFQGAPPVGPGSQPAPPAPAAAGAGAPARPPGVPENALPIASPTHRGAIVWVDPDGQVYGHNVGSEMSGGRYFKREVDPALRSAAERAQAQADAPSALATLGEDVGPNGEPLYPSITSTQQTLPPGTGYGRSAQAFDENGNPIYPSITSEERTLPPGGVQSADVSRYQVDANGNRVQVDANGNPIYPSITSEERTLPPGTGYERSAQAFDQNGNPIGYERSAQAFDANGNPLPYGPSVTSTRREVPNVLNDRSSPEDWDRAARQSFYNLQRYAPERLTDEDRTAAEPSQSFLQQWRQWYEGRRDSGNAPDLWNPSPGGQVTDENGNPVWTSADFQEYRVPIAPAPISPPEATAPPPTAPAPEATQVAFNPEQATLAAGFDVNAAAAPSARTYDPFAPPDEQGQAGPETEAQRLERTVRDLPALPVGEQTDTSDGEPRARRQGRDRSADQNLDVTSGQPSDGETEFDRILREWRDQQPQGEQQPQEEQQQPSDEQQPPDEQDHSGDGESSGGGDEGGGDGGDSGDGERRREDDVSGDQ